MSILIKGMEMPKSCFGCSLRKVWDDGVQCLVNKGLWMDADSKHHDCPLIPVPPHGDLIDRDAIKNRYKYELTRTYLDDYAKGYQTALKAVLGDTTPTIIPAEEGE